MDPNECVRLINDAVSDYFEATTKAERREAREEICEHTENLNRWLCSGGFRPSAKFDRRIVRIFKHTADSYEGYLAEEN